MSAKSDREPSVIVASGNNSGQPPRNRETSNTDNTDRVDPEDLDFSSDDDESDEDRGRTLLGARRQPQRQLSIDTNVRAGTALPQVDDTEQAEAAKEKPISWRSLPRKDQLFVITLARLSEPLTQTSLGSYLFYQLQSFDKSLPDATISYQAGIIQAAFPFAQFLTAMFWGRVADSEYGGRKRVVYIGLLGTMCSIIGFGFSQSFPMAVACRCLGGVLNGNIGVMRTMISEIIKEKKYQSRAFLILPMTFNIGVIIGPILGMRSGSQWYRASLTSLRWITCRSCWQLSLPVRTRLSHWRQGRGLLDEAVAVCIAKHHERVFPSVLGACRHLFPGRDKRALQRQTRPRPARRQSDTPLRLSREHRNEVRLLCGAWR